jgi:hypothetical protein
MGFEFEALDFLYFFILNFLGGRWVSQHDTKGRGDGKLRTATSSVILRTSLPSEDLHFTLYRAFAETADH